MGALDMCYDVSSAIEEIMLSSNNQQKRCGCYSYKSRRRSSPFVTTSDLRKILCDISKTQQNVLFSFLRVVV